MKYMLVFNDDDITSDLDFDEVTDEVSLLLSGGSYTVEAMLPMERA